MVPCTAMISQKKKSQDDVQRTIENLKCVLAENQETIRAFDTKSEILAVVLTLIVGVIQLAFPDSRHIQDTVFHTAINCLSAAGLVALAFVGFVLYPSRRPAERINLGSVKPKHAWYVTLNADLTVSKFLAQVKTTDWGSEIAYEVCKTAAIRDRKSYWFRWSLWVSGFLLVGTMALIITFAWYG
jgi:hypothetical protein